MAGILTRQSDGKYTGIRGDGFDDGNQGRAEHDAEHGPVLRKNIRAIADLEERALHERGTATV